MDEDKRFFWYNIKYEKCNNIFDDNMSLLWISKGLYEKAQYILYRA